MQNQRIAQNILLAKKSHAVKSAPRDCEPHDLAINEPNTHEHCKTQRLSLKLELDQFRWSSNAICEKIICMHLLFSKSMQLISFRIRLGLTLGIYPIFLNGFRVFSIRIIVLKSMQIYAYEL